MKSDGYMKATILLIDDDITTREMIEHIFKSLKVDLLIVNEDNTALEYATRFQPDLIISGFDMPVGIDLKRQLAKIPGLRHVPFIFLADKSTEDGKRRELLTEDDDVLTKPFDPAVLLKRIQFLIDRARVYHKDSDNPLSDEVRNPFVHSAPPKIPGYDIHFATIQEETGGGDIIDYFKFQSLKYAFIHGDVMGKGTKAKFFAYSFMGYVRGLLYPMIMADQDVSPSMLVSRLSQLVDIDPFLQDVFVTILIVLFDFKNHSLTYTNAGYMPTLYFFSQENKITELNAGGGIPAFSFSDYEQESIKCMPNDILCICSDGVTESKDSNNNLLGLEPIKKYIFENSHCSSKEIVEGIITMVNKHNSNRQSHDDRSVTIIKRQNETLVSS